MSLDAVLLTLALAQEGIYRQPAPQVATAVVVEVETFANANHGDAIVNADDLTPMSCDSGTGFWMVMSTWQANRLIELNPGIVCIDGERYGVTQ